MAEPTQHPPSPCTNLCTIDPGTYLCAGCFRTLEEIAAWSEMTASEKEGVLREVERRRAARGGAPDPA